MAPALLVPALWAQSLDQLTLVRVVELKGDTHHAQGIEVEDGRLWVTSVDRAAQSGYLHEFSLTDGALLREVKLRDGPRYHPGGIAGTKDSLWIPIAEYRAHSSAIVERRNKRSLAVEQRFAVDDHIGCVAIDGATVIGGNWDARELYFWDTSGKLLRKASNPTGNAFQDIKVVGGRLVGSGLLADRAGAIDWVALPGLEPLRRIAAGKTSRGDPYTREGMTIRGDELFLLPEDAPSRLFVFRLETAQPRR